MLNRKEIAHDLDRAAGRAESVNASPATAKQCWFLAGLIAERNETAEGIGCGHSNAILTSRQASLYIDQYLREKTERAPRVEA